MFTARHQIATTGPAKPPDYSGWHTKLRVAAQATILAHVPSLTSLTSTVTPAYSAAIRALNALKFPASVCRDSAIIKKQFLVWVFPRSILSPQTLLNRKHSLKIVEDELTGS
jgi:hypothetical protein